jgi:hypothetical protein
MLLQMIVNQPQMLGSVLKNTPVWVWGLLAALIWLGLTQVRARTASLKRIVIFPVAMTLMALVSMATSFGNSPTIGYVMLAWLVAAGAMVALIGSTSAPAGTSYDATTRTFAMRGSWVPMVIILGIFLTKYVVGVETAMNPGLARDGEYTLIVGALYGVFSGVFAGRAARLLRLAFKPAGNAALPVRA